jgi:hypothetical protein
MFSSGFHVTAAAALPARHPRNPVPKVMDMKHGSAAIAFILVEKSLFTNGPPEGGIHASPRP